MATRLQLRKGTTTEHNTFVGANGEVTVDTTKQALVLHDGVTAGGKPLPTLESGTVPLSQLPEATTSTKGVVQLATTPEAVAGTNTTKTITPSTMVTGIKSALNVTGTAPMYACRAWVNFNGTGTPSIRASGNVSSITDNGVGDYTINFTTAMPAANYSFSGFCNFQSGTSSAGILSFGNDFSMSAGSLRVKAANATTGGTQDSQYITVSVFR